MLGGRNWIMPCVGQVEDYEVRGIVRVASSIILGKPSSRGTWL